MNSDRIKWLERGFSELRQLLPECDPTATITVGRTHTKAIGDCCKGFRDTSTTGEEFIITLNPAILNDPFQTLHVVLHEMIHQADRLKSGHRRRFVVLAKRVGLVRPWTSTTPGPELKQRLYAILQKLGPMPKGFGNYERKAAGTRLRKWVCECGVIARVASDDFQATCRRCNSAFLRNEK